VGWGMSAKSPYEATLDDLPDEWGEVPIVELGKVLSGSTPSRDVPTYWGGDIPWVTPGELTGLRSKYISQTIEAITPDGLNGSGANLLPQNSLLITTRATLGSRAINTRPMATNQGFKSIVFKNPTDANYYYHWAEKLVPELTRRASGTTFLEISGSQFCQIRVPNPPESERVKIAQILDTLDTQIRQTEALIAKLERIKQGLLTDLLTRGIDQNGQLRPTPDQAPHLYKDSRLGRIPREWGESIVGSEFEIQLGKMLDAEKNAGELKPYLGNKAVQWEHINLSELSEIRLTTSDKDRFRLQSGDLLVCEGGEVGRAALWEEQIEECYYQKALHRLRPINTFRPELMLQLLRFWSQRDVISNYTSQTSIAHLTKEKLAQVPLPVPPVTEQETIINVLNSHRHRIESEQKNLSALLSLKIGLMDDLLTGRVRVTPLLEEAQQRKA